jgi:hypothetical protein
MNDAKICALAKITNRSTGTLDYRAIFTVELHGIRIGGCILAQDGDGKFYTLGPRLGFRDQLRFVAIVDAELREDVTAAAVAEWQCMGARDESRTPASSPRPRS